MTGGGVAAAPGWQRLVLVGFMGAGKSTVGRVLADRLGWRFVDLDEEIEVDAGLSIPRLFAERGEPAFRDIETRVARRLLAGERLVLATGGGWAAEPGRLDELPPATATVWLRVSAATALDRVRASPVVRPLLEVDRPLERARRMIAERSPAYSAARCTVDTERCSVEDVTARILEWLSAHPPERPTE